MPVPPAKKTNDDVSHLKECFCLAELTSNAWSK
ncbi:hypothetical protein LINGRAHAP2_LOCUS17246 [Linum grandiflorum]